jgi:hypothetical protein
MRLLMKNQVKRPRKADRKRDCARLTADRDRRQPAQHSTQADGRHDDGDDRPAEQGTQHDALQREAEQDHHQDGRADGDQHGHLGRQRERGDETRQHHELALREVDGVGGLVDKHEAERD